MTKVIHRVEEIREWDNISIPIDMAIYMQEEGFLVVTVNFVIDTNGLTL